MTQQSQQPDNAPQFSIAELGAKFGEQLAQAYAQIITLEKQLTAQALAIQSMTKNEVRLQGHIQELEAKVSEFTRQEYDFVDHIQELEVELVELKKSLEIMINEPQREKVVPYEMSEASAKLADEGREIIQGNKEAASIETAS